MPFASTAAGGKSPSTTRVVVRSSSPRIKYAASKGTQTVKIRRGPSTIAVSVAPPTKYVPGAYAPRPVWDLGGGQVSNLPPGIQPTDVVMTPFGDETADQFFDMSIPEGQAEVQVGDTKKEISMPLLLGGVAIVGIGLGWLLTR